VSCCILTPFVLARSLFLLLFTGTPNLCACFLRFSAEPSPPGRWEIDMVDSLGTNLQHSVYDDPAAGERILDWLGRRTRGVEPPDHGNVL
jgi:hypothetical protein